MKITLLALVSFILSSCTVTHFYYVSSKEMPLNEKNEYVFENDTLRIVYNFNGLYGPVNLSITNKLRYPLQVDWKRSALVREGEVLGYHNTELEVDGLLQRSSYREGTVEGKVMGEASIQFLPPRSTVNKQTVNILEDKIDPFLFGKMKWQRIKYPGHKYRLKSRGLDYTEENSPVRFRSYLTFVVQTDSQVEMAIDHSFFVSRLWEFNKKGSFIPEKVRRSGHVFYN